MSPSAIEPQPATYDHADFAALLPPEIWTEIFRHLDIESLVNMVEAAPALECFALNRTTLRSVTFEPEADDRTVGLFLQVTREQMDIQDQANDLPLSAPVEELRFTNCLLLHSVVILDCVQHCDNLRELYCVNCVVEPDELFFLLSVTRVAKLEWSLHDEKYYESKLNLDKIGLISNLSKSNGPKLATMYVEMVPTAKTEYVLDQFLPGCGMLRRLHIHTVIKGPSRSSSMATCSRVFASSALAMFELTRDTPETATFRSSCEQDLSIKVDSRVGRPQDLHGAFSPQSKIQYNVDLRSKPPATFNVRGIGEVVKQGNVLRGFQQVNVCLDADPQATYLFSEAAGRPECWRDVRRLALTLKNPAATESPTSPTAHRGYEKPMWLFFRACVSRITELNLSTFHFAKGFNGCDLVASALPNLRELAIPPCAANYADSLESLAGGCAWLEHLDIRASGYMTSASSCGECQLPLAITGRNLELLHKKTRLRKLSIDETAKINNMEFLLACEVAELRLSVDGVCDEEIKQCPAKLCRLLTANSRLHFLTLVACEVTMSFDLATALSQIRNLRHLCVLTTASHSPPVLKEFFIVLENGLPKLLTAHIHYTCMCKIMHVSTWIRHRKHSGGSEASQGTSPTEQGLFVYDKPCVGRLCCIDSFIGLVGPRNHF
ncbi:hypothetical protein MRX96_011178 [Rhipicephalus microplus]